MKRLHITRKPPKIKRTVFDGSSSSKTKYVRMTPVVFDEVKKECKSEIPVLADQVFEFPSRDNEKNITETKMSYSEKKKKIIEAWDKLRLELLVTRIEELSPATNICCFCNSVQDKIIYCQDCGPAAYYCDCCCNRIHRNILFHKPQKWKESIYIPFSMSNELIRRDHICESSYTSDLYAVDVKGTQHTCKIQLCRCEDPALTLLRYNLWPATPTNPRIGFDLRFMELLSVLQLECHLPAKTFCDALACMHSNYITLTSNVERNIYRAVVGDCLTEYNYHRSSLSTGNNVTESTFSMECPICLKNPSIVSMDANFGLVHKSSSGNGHGRQSARHQRLFFLDHDNLKKFVDDYAVDSKTSCGECSNFQAGSVIRSKIKNQKLDVTGIFGTVCKHDIPIYFADLAHGERLSYPVYMLKCLLEDRTDQQLVVMYDIACKLHQHLRKNNNTDILEKCTFAVPVFHSFAHNTACQLQYGQRYAKSTGMTDGEGIERVWSYLRGFKKITKEMSLSNRQDLLTEAMLHHIEKQSWNLGRRLAAKKNKCEKVIAENENVITKILADLNETAEKIDTWHKDWKTQCNKDDVKALSLTVDEQYAECLEQIDLKKHILEAEETMEERSNAEKNIERLMKDCQKLKRKSNYKQLQLQSDQGQLLLASAKRKRRKISLMKLKELATERQYLSSMMKKYAEGQGIGLRISKQFSANYNKIKKEVEHFKVITSKEEDVSSFLSPASTLFDELTSIRLGEPHQKAVEAKSLLEHAKEECSNINIEMRDFLTYLAAQSNQILQTIDSVLHMEMTRFHLGKLQFLYLKHLNIEILFDSCFSLFEDTATANIVMVPKKVHGILAAEILSKQELTIPTEEELKVILEEIESLENNFGMNEDDDVDDDDVNDDDDTIEEDNDNLN